MNAHNASIGLRIIALLLLEEIESPMIRRFLTSETRHIALTLSAAFTVLIAIFLSFGELGLLQMDNINATYNDVTLRRAEKLRLVQDAVLLSNHNIHITLQLFLGQNETPANTLLTERSENSEKILALIEEIRHRCESEKEAHLLDVVENTRQQYITSSMRAVHLFALKDMNGASLVFANETLPAQLKYQAAWIEFAGFQKDQLDMAAKKVRADYYSTRRISSLFITLAVLVFLVIAVLTTHQASRSWQQEVVARRHVEGELQRSQERIHIAARAASIGSWEWNLVTGRNTWSDISYLLLGLRPEDKASLQVFMNSVHPDDREMVQEKLNAAIQLKGDFQTEFRAVWPDGSVHWLASTGRVFAGDHGSRTRMTGVVMDIDKHKRAEESLKTQAAFLEAQANSTIDGILVVDGDGRRRLLNRRMVELFKIPPEIVSDKDDRSLLEWVASLVKDSESFLARVKHLYLNPSETGRDEIELKDGTILDRYSAPVVDENGTCYGRIWTFRDVTQRKGDEDALRQLSMAVEQSPVSVVITNPQGIISYVNRKFTNLTGYSADEVLGRNPRMLNSGRVSSDVYRTLWSNIKQGHEWQGEFCNKKKNGEIYWEAATITPITNLRGEITHFLAVKEDITERKQAGKKLRQMQFSLEKASDSVFWIDAQARIVYANEAACRSLGHPHEELLTLSIPDIDPGFPKDVWTAFWKRLKTQGSMTFDTQHQSKQGRCFPVEVTANYLEFDGQEYCLAFARDITERRVLESQLRQAQKLEGIGQLAAGIAHEINTPTQFVTDNLTFLRDSWISIHQLIDLYRSSLAKTTGIPPSVAMAIRESERSCDLDFVIAEAPRAIDQGLDGARRVARIVRAIKEFAHPDSADKTATDINRAVESTVTVGRNEWKYVADLTTDFDETLPPVVCYPGDINQVVLNLVVNAAHSIKDKVKDGDKGQIKVCTRKRGDYAEISVTDTGTGIPEEIRSRVFDPFFTTKEVGKGTGQGLALAYTVIAKKHSGKIWFETELGRGTTFFIDLPLMPAGSIKEH
ncbi:MAG: PAS domain S-box protein [Terriglobales bacterium]